MISTELRVDLGELRTWSTGALVNLLAVIICWLMLMKKVALTDLRSASSQLACVDSGSTR